MQSMTPRVSQHPIELLTQEALDSSESGHWDDVALLYQRRAQEFAFNELPVSVVKRLIAIDLVIQERAKIVQAATQQRLDDMQEQGRKLRQRKHKLTYANSAGTRFVRSA
ncbi:MAG: hypothetical protein NPIRA02_02840 [Nitrospirales bacterium]|nr:MAG: hypothetical protein NPIRA02_02840 [Nitrospirales bacterium]